MSLYKTAAPDGVERLPSGGIKYRGQTFPGFNKPRASNRPGKKKMVLAKKGDEVKLVHFGQKGYKHNYSAKAKKSYLARSAGIKGKDDKFSANYWSRRVLWPSGQKADGSSKKTASEKFPWQTKLYPGSRVLGETVIEMDGARTPVRIIKEPNEYMESGYETIYQPDYLYKPEFKELRKMFGDNPSRFSDPDVQAVMRRIRSSRQKTASTALAVATPLVTGLGGAYLGHQLHEGYGRYAGGVSGVMLGNYLANNYIDPKSYETLKALVQAERKGEAEVAKTIRKLDSRQHTRPSKPQKPKRRKRRKEKTAADLPGVRSAGDKVLRKYMAKYKNDLAGFNSKQTRLDMRNELERAYAPIMSKSQLASWRRDYNSRNKLAAALYRPRGTIFVTDGKGNVYAGKRGVDSPAGYGATSPYYFPGGGILEEGATHTPSKKEILDAVRKESLEELGFKINKLKLLRSKGLRLDMPDWWVDRQFRKRGVEYKGLDEYYVHAREGARDDSLYDSEGDAFAGKYYPIKKVVKALQDYADSGEGDFGPANRLQAELLSKLSGYNPLRMAKALGGGAKSSYSAYKKAKKVRKLVKAVHDAYSTGSDIQGAVDKITKDDHPTQRLKERTNLDPAIIGQLRQSIAKNQHRIPPGSHHVELDEGARAIIKEIRRRHVLATILGSNMNRYPGENLQYLYQTKTAGFNLGQVGSAIGRGAAATGMAAARGVNKVIGTGSSAKAQAAMGAGAYGAGYAADRAGYSNTGLALKSVGLAAGARAGTRGLGRLGKSVSRGLGGASKVNPRLKPNHSGGLFGGKVDSAYRGLFNRHHSRVANAARGGATSDGTRIGKLSDRVATGVANRVAGSPITDPNARRILAGGSAVPGRATSRFSRNARGASNLVAPVLGNKYVSAGMQTYGAASALNSDNPYAQALGVGTSVAFNPMLRRGMRSGLQQRFFSGGARAGRRVRAAAGGLDYGSSAISGATQAGNAVMDPNSVSGMATRGGLALARNALLAGGGYAGYRAARD
jgi:8-oxo-dGTP pyrophosphatase MutT (NUDIX family)